MRMLRTMGMNASCAQCRMYIVAAIASTVRATLRTLISASTMEFRASVESPAVTRRTGSAISAVRADREPGPRLKRLVDRDASFGSFGRSDDGELHVA